jgi:hypothetical protein
VNNALATYYDRSVERAAAASEGRIGEGELRRWFGTALITATGTRGLAFRGAPGTPWRIPGLALKELEEAHVIRREDRSGTITHELTHDRFIEPIQKSNDKWLARYQDAERIRAKLEENVERESDELDEVELRQAEGYLNSPEAKILGASPEARQLVRRSRNKLEEAKRRQAEELEEARRRAQQQEQVVKLLRRQRVFGIIVGVLGVIVLLVVGYVINQKRVAWKQRARALAEAGNRFREKAKADLVDETNPIKDITALRNLALALKSNPQDTEAAGLARNLLLQRVWCPPAAPDVRYRQDALLAATFAPGGSKNDVFALAGDGQLQFWNGDAREPLFVRCLFDKPEPDDQHVVQAGSASFSPDGQWLLIIPPTLVSAANVDAPAQGAPQQGTASAHTDGRHVSCNLQIWRWSPQNRTYESIDPEWKIQRPPGSRINVVWSSQSDRFVVIAARGTNEAQSTFFETEGNSVQELDDRSKQLTEMKIVALAFGAYGNLGKQSVQISDDVEVLQRAIVAVSLDPPVLGAVRKVTLLRGDDLQVVPGAMHGNDSILLSDGFQPNGIVFGPRNNEITLTSWSGVRILDLRTGNVTPIPPPTFRDQFMRIVVGPFDTNPRLVATSLYGRVEVAKTTQMDQPAEPVVFRGYMGNPQFSSDGQRLLILSGGIFNVLDSMRLIDVSPLYRTKEHAPEKFEDKPAPPWLADIASAVSASDPSNDGSLMTLETVRNNYPGSKAGDPYESVWKRFFPDESGIRRR